ncbi:MAG: MFS transporter [Mycobacteriaceae bacterium]|nr:MFS transporter [Mycobacteriaceae bacterium]
MTTSPPAQAGATVLSPAGLSHRQILTIVSGLILGVLLAALDQTIVSTSIRTVADDLNGYSMQAWVTTAYLITSTLSTPLYGKLSDMFGRKPFFMAAISIFIGGSLLCTFAGSMYQLAGFRAVQGIGAGGLMSLALAIMGDIVSPLERARYQGYFLAAFGTSSVLGPVIGGLLSGQHEILGVAGWRWIFLVNVPVGLFALAVVYRVLNLPRSHKPGVRVDWWGVAALAVGVTPLLVVAEQGRTWGWSDPKALACYLIGVVGVAAFVAVEARLGDAALIPLRLFRNSTFALGVLISVVVGAAMFGGISLVPQYLQAVRGASPTMAGLQMLPMVLGMMVASIVSGQIISRTGRYRVFPILGAVMLTSGLFLLHYLTPDTPLWRTMVFMAVTGFGLGNLMQPLTVAIQNSAEPKDMGVSTSAATFFRQIGGTLGVAVFLSVLFSVMPARISDEMHAAGAQPDYRHAIQAGLRSDNPADAAFSQGIVNRDPAATGKVLDDSSVLQQLDPTLARPLKDGFADAMQTVFLSASAVALLAFVMVLFWKEIPLRRTSGLQAAAAAQAEAEAGLKA